MTLDARRWGPMLAATLMVACSGKLLEISIEEQSEVVVDKGTPLEIVIQDLGFGDFTDLDLTSKQAIENQGVEPGDISDVYFDHITLTVTDPSGGDLSFLDSLEFFVSADGLPTILVASRYDFPKGTQQVEMIIEDVDIVDYVVSESMDVTTEVSGSRPSADTTILAELGLRVGATVQGACNQVKKK